ncbi:MAG: PAS domain S-box protein [Desulfococcaceae bacterium]
MTAESPSPSDHFLAAALSVLICECVLAGLSWAREGTLSPIYLAAGLILPALLFFPFWFFLCRRPGRNRPATETAAVPEPSESNGNPNFLRQVFDGIQDGILVLDRNMCLLDANRRAIELFGLPTPLDGRPCFAVCRGESGPCAICPGIPTLAAGEPHRETVGHKCPDGQRLRLEQAAFPLRNPDGETMGVILYLTDVSDRRRKEVERQRLTTALEQVAESIVITDGRGAIQYVNPAFERITGYPRSEILGQTPGILKSGMHDDAFYRAMWQTLRRGDVWSGHFINRKKNGELYEEEASISPVKDPEGEIAHFVAVKRDVTEEIKMERQLRQAQKMESIGTLAGGIAHDFNNILFPIIGYTEITLDDLPPESTGRANLREVLAAANRAQELVQQILTFSRSDEQERKPLKIQVVVKEALKLLKSTVPATIEIVQNIDPACGPVLADPTRIHQIVMNLCTNAYHAMAETGGRMEVNLRRTEVDPDALDHNLGIRPGPALALSVRDTGPGMDRFTLGRVFEPYFTTKDPTKGTGMGLAVVHGIVKACGGGIQVQSEAGKGATFTIFFPALDIEAETAPAPPSEEVAGGTEHILLVDDEVQITEMERQMLERLGYTVTVRTSSVEALEAFRATPHRFDLVITDQTMPNITGAALTRQCRNIRPDVPVILCTGFSEALSPVEARFLGVNEYLMKPVVKRQMARAIRRALGKPDPEAPPAKGGANRKESAS